MLGCFDERFRVSDSWYEVLDEVLDVSSATFRALGLPRPGERAGDAEVLGNSSKVQVLLLEGVFDLPPMLPVECRRLPSI